MNYHRSNNVEIRIARIFNTYGPRMDPLDGRVLSNFVVQALRGEPISIYGEGDQTRSFCYVDDLVEGMIRLMDQEESTGPINLGNPDEISIRRLAELVLELVGSGSSIVKMPLPKDDPRRRQPDVSLARSILGWLPKVPLKEGLERTIAYFRTVVS